MTVQAQIGDLLVIPPVLRESVGLPSLPRVAVAVRRVLPLHERRVDRPTDPRQAQRQPHRRHRPEDDSGADRDDPPLLPPLRDHGVAQARRRGLVRGLGAARLRGAWRGDRVAVGVQDRRLVGRVVVAGHQVHQAALGPVPEVRDQGLGVLDGPRPGHDADDQAMLGVERPMVPVISLVVVGRVGAVAVRLLLGDEGPLLIELDLGRPGGKSPRVRRERP